MEKRHHPRIQLDERGWRAVAVDQVKSEKLGDIVNLSSQGLMMITSRAVATESLFQIVCGATSPDGARHEFSAGIMVLWRSDASEPGMYWVGTQIIDIDEHSKARLQKLRSAMQGGG